MAFNDFNYRVRINNDTHEIWKFCDSTFKTGYWGKMYAFTSEAHANSVAVYCFYYEEDATMFLLRWPNA